MHLRTEHHAGAVFAAGGYLVFAAALVAGRLQGDRLAARFSRTRVVQAGGCTAAAGVGVAILAPGISLALVGWALVGLSVAPLAPTVLGAGPAVGRLPAPAAIATVTTIGYLGSFTGPPLVGVVAEVTSLSTALVLLAGAGVAAAVLAGR